MERSDPSWPFRFLQISSMPPQTPNDDRLLTVLTDIRNWIRATAHRPVQALLEEALPDAKSRTAYQMLDGNASVEQVRTACKMSPAGDPRHRRPSQCPQHPGVRFGRSRRRSLG